jgi:glyoxylase-like metal-dependent hydrolase (beta-lactamase superfamily II)
LSSVLIINSPRSPEPSIVLAGDSLLVDEVERPDFGSGAPTTQFESVTRLARVPD